MATCDSPSMVSQQEHGQRDAEEAPRDRPTAAVAMETNAATNAAAAAATTAVDAPDHGPVSEDAGSRSPLRITPEPSRKESFTTANGTASVTGSGTLPGAGSGSGSDSAPAPAAASPVAPAKQIPCNESATSFSSFPKYMEPHCPSASLPSAAGPEDGGEEGDSEGDRDAAELGDNSAKEMEEEEEEEEESDVENLCGEIVYQPDGSAFILEDSKEQRGAEGLSGLPFRSLLPPQSFPPTAQASAASSQSTSGPGGEGDRPEQPATAPMSFYPQVINTFHIASSLGKPFSSDPGSSFPNTSALGGAGPVLHSFRVYDLRHESDKDYLTVDGAAKNSCVSKDVPNNVDLSQFEGCVSDGRQIGRAHV